MYIIDIEKLKWNPDLESLSAYMASLKLNKPPEMIRVIGKSREVLFELKDTLPSTHAHLYRACMIHRDDPLIDRIVLYLFF